MYRLYLCILGIFSLILLSCTSKNSEPVNLISPSGRLLARNTQEIKKILAYINQDINNADSIIINEILYDEEDSVTVAEIKYTYQGEQKSTLIYMNNIDSSQKDKTLLENSKMTVIIQPKRPVVIILTDKDNQKDTFRLSTKYKYKR